MLSVRVHYFSVMSHILLVVEEVVRHVIERVSKDAAAVCSRCRMPVPEDDAMREFPERCGQNNEECGWHNQPVLIHGQIMMNAMEEEVECDANTVVRKMPIRSMLAFAWEADTRH